MILHKKTVKYLRIFCLTIGKNHVIIIKLSDESATQDENHIEKNFEEILKKGLTNSERCDIMLKLLLKESG